MIYRSYTPSPPLADLVERFWLCSDAPAHRRERILPTGTIELVINLREDEIRILAHIEACESIIGVVAEPGFDADKRFNRAVFGIAKEADGIVFNGDEFLDEGGEVILSLSQEG